MRYLSPGNSCRLDWRLLWLWILCFVSPHLIAQNLGELLELQGDCICLKPFSLPIFCL